MAGRAKGKEVALQLEVDSQEDWEEVISKDGLTGIHVMCLVRDFNIITALF